MFTSVADPDPTDLLSWIRADTEAGEERGHDCLRQQAEMTQPRQEGGGGAERVEREAGQG